MNKFNCYNNMQISRYAAIKYAQHSANSNMLTLFNAIMNNGWGVVAAVGIDGKMPDTETSLKVSLKAGSNSILEIQPGVAITPAGEVAVNYKVAYVNATTIVGTEYGTYYLYIKHKIEYKMTGEETFYSGHTSSTMGTIEQDSCEFELTMTPTNEQVLLATVYCASGALLIPASLLNVEATIADGVVVYPSTTGIAFSGITSITAGTFFSAYPYVIIGGEYLQWVGPNEWARGMFSTNAATLYAGKHNMSWSPIIDQRQTNILSLPISLNSIDIINSGILERGGEYRHIEITAKKSIPTTPAIDTTRSEVVWLNSHLAAGYLTADMVSAYEEIQGIQSSIANTLVTINQLNTDYAEAAGNTTTQERLEYEIRKQRMVLMDYRTQQANLTSILSTRTMDSLSGNDIRKFAYRVTITEPTHTDTIDEPVMYEVEAEYFVVDAPYSSTSPSQRKWYYSRRKNVEEIDWETMERTYEGAEDADALYRTIDIPISFGERVRYRVRAIGESGAVSAFSSYSFYNFTGYTVSQQFIMVSNIYNLLHPDPYREAIITRELVELLYSVIDKFNNSANRLVAIESQVSSLIAEV